MTGLKITTAAWCRRITADTALRLGRYFGNSPQFWLGLQAAYDVEVEHLINGTAIEGIPRLVLASVVID